VTAIRNKRMNTTEKEPGYWQLPEIRLLGRLTSEITKVVKTRRTFQNHLKGHLSQNSNTGLISDSTQLTFIVQFVHKSFGLPQLVVVIPTNDLRLFKEADVTRQPDGTTHSQPCSLSSCSNRSQKTLILNSLLKWLKHFCTSIIILIIFYSVLLSYFCIFHAISCYTSRCF